VIGEGARRQKAAHTCADHDRMTTEMRHDTGFLSLKHRCSPHDTGDRAVGFDPPLARGGAAGQTAGFRTSFFGEDAATSPALRPNASLPARLFACRPVNS
jgi:hypothetical protein